MQDCLAVLNAGSSSIKFALYRAGDRQRLLHGHVEGIGTAPHLNLIGADGRVAVDRRWAASELDHDSAAAEIFAAVRTAMTGARLAAIGHRVVHGGTSYRMPVQVAKKVLADLAAFIPLASLHQPHNLASIRAVTVGGLDGLFFTAGIGEHDAATRANVMKGCAWLGVAGDAARNAAGTGRISADGSKATAWVIPTDEECMIAHHTAALLAALPVA